MEDRSAHLKFPEGDEGFAAGQQAESAEPDRCFLGSEVSPENVTVAIPTLNEAEALGRVLDELLEEGYRNILVIDGYSDDGTPDVARARGVKVVFQHGAGKAGAVKTALEHVSTPYVLFMDGDYTYDPRDIKRLLLHAGGYDEVIGVRKASENIPLLHRLGNKIINFTFRLLLGANLSDVCSGMYLVRTETLRGFELEGRGYSVEVELAAYVSSNGRVTEVPIGYRKRLGRSKLNSFRDGLSILASIIKLAWTYNPVFLAALAASLLLIPGILITGWALYVRYVEGVWPTGSAWLGMILLMIGLQGLILAVFALLIKSMEKRILRLLRDMQNNRR